AIGVGGMAAVLRANDLELGREVALKILPPEMAADPENITRFKSEARAAAKLDHENVARVYFCGEDQGLHFIAFEYVEGVNLRALGDVRLHLAGAGPGAAHRRRPQRPLLARVYLLPRLDRPAAGAGGDRRQEAAQPPARRADRPARPQPAGPGRGGRGPGPAD